MPELPEVETIRRSLVKYLVGRRVERVEVFLPKTIKFPSVEEFIDRIRRQKIFRLERRGKYMVVLLENGDALVFHLRMTGRLYFREEAVWNKHMRVRFLLEGGGALCFEDVRTFGEIHLLRPQEKQKFAPFQALGPEPLTKEFNVYYLGQTLAKSKQRIKSFLLDQERVSGLGNIYVDEALFFAGIHPLRQACTLNRDEIARLHKAVNEVIEEGIHDGGTTFRDYVNGEGQEGLHQQKLRVYHREGEPCSVCGVPVEKTRVGGRGTRFCPKCQPLRDNSMKLIGLTGSIASGKSTVSRYLAKLGAHVIDIDKIAHELAKPQKVLWKIYLEHFGESILDNAGLLRREKIAAQVFSHPEEKNWIDSVAHPLIAESVEKKVAALAKKGVRVVFLDVPLLFEAGWNRMVDLIWVVYVSKENQLNRLMKRNGYTEEAAMARICSQMDVDEKKERADCVIDNNGHKKETLCQVKQAWDELCGKTKTAKSMSGAGKV